LCCPKKNFGTKQKTITPPLQVKWSVPKYWKDQKLYYEDYRAIIDGSHVRSESLTENEESGEEEPE
jgi:hypothetical protein